MNHLLDDMEFALKWAAIIAGGLAVAWVIIPALWIIWRAA